MARSANMLCSQVRRFDPQKTTAQQFTSLHLFALLVVLLQLCGPGAGAIKLFSDHEHEPIFNKFVAIDGNVPVKFFNPESELHSVDWEIDQRVQRYDDVESGTNQFADIDFSAEKEAEQEGSEYSSVAEGSNEQGLSSQTVLPRRERRLNWNRWLHWFKPIDRTSMGFLPVRGRKTTFIAARGKKSTTNLNAKQVRAPKQSQSASQPKTSYYLVALTMKPLP